jgi:hypothetical protein
MAPTISVTTAVILAITVLPAAGQDTRASGVAAQQEQRAEALTPERPPTGDRVVRRLQKIFKPTPPAIVPTFGGVRGGSGPAFGAAFLAPLGRSLVTTRAAWSTKNTKRVGASLSMPAEVLGIGLTLGGWWEDAPHTEWFGMGMQSSSQEEYGLTTRALTTEADLPHWGPLVVAGGVGFFQFDATSVGESSWIETTVAAAVDTRTSPGYTRRGALYSISYAYSAPDTGGYSGFNRITVDLRQFVPLLHEHWVLAGQARMEMTDGADAAPFFLLPSLGGGSSLRGYSRYRFVDQQAVLLRGELRWMASEALDLALFVDGGTVAATVKQLRVADFARGVGIGSRFHASRFTVFRVEVARGSEGWHLHVGQDVTF